MVTPVHRFQSLEGITHSGYRYNRSPRYHARQQLPPSVHYNGSTSNLRTPQMGRSLEMIAPGNTPTMRTNTSPTSKMKCGVWIFFAVVTCFLVIGSYYGIPIAGEALIFSSLLVIVLIIGGLISLCKAKTTFSPSNTPSEAPNTHQTLDDTQVPTPSVRLSQNTAELPPPPYHIAVMLAPANDLDAIQVIRSSPPPSYEKAVT